MRNWKYFRLIIGTGFFLLVCPFLVTEKIHIHSKAIAQQTTKYSDKTTFRWRDRLTQENLEIEAQQLEDRATQQFQNGELEAALETWQQVLEICHQQ
ncbi:MAG: hypothetical protein F6K24_21665, partial [Okeania sp. SIO2D1]|nr:hypothetical protein [Okeania sp. SIO2D1]